VTPDRRRQGRSLRKIRRLASLIDWGSVTASIVAVSETFVRFNIELRDSANAMEEAVEDWTIDARKRSLFNGKTISEEESQPSFTSG